VIDLPRPRKCRKVCRLPEVSEFVPVNGHPDKAAIILSLEEYETIRLIDKEGLSQEECGKHMNAARTTIQQIYTNARRKLAEAVVEGLPLRIEGGNFQLCGGEEAFCKRKNCHRNNDAKMVIEKIGGQKMKVAVTYENGQIFQHFGHTGAFKLYEIEDGKVVSSGVVSTQGRGHGALAAILSACEIDVLICGGIGGGAQIALAQAGIKLYGGVTGDADVAVEALLNGTLAYNPNVMCSHHGDHHHGHTCGEHGCGSGHCGH